MMELLYDIAIRRGQCGRILEYKRDEIDFDSYVYEHGENGMGEEIEYVHENENECDCGNLICFRISGNEYPIGAFDYENSEIDGGFFVKKPCMGITYFYDEFDPNIAYPIFNRIQRLIIDINEDDDLIYRISPREFEKIIEQLLKDQGFETELTQETRDGGKDIIATKMEVGGPIVFYIECKHYGERNKVNLNDVRALYGVHSADRINKSMIVTTGRVTRDARTFIEERKTHMSVIEIEDIRDLIKLSAHRYENEY